MKNVIIAGLDNMAFSAADMIDPQNMKLVGIAVPIEEAWNIYDENGAVKEDIDEMPVMPLESAAAAEPDCIVLAASCSDDDEKLKYMLYCADYRGEVISLHDFYKGFSLRTAVIRKLVWRINELGIEGAAAELGAYRGDISWQLNALLPQRRLYLFDTFTGYDSRDIKAEREQNLSDAKEGQFALSVKEAENIEKRLLERMPYPAQVEIRKGWFPESAYELEDEKFAMVYMDAGLYAPTYSGLQYFFPRMSRGGVIILAGYENGRSLSVRKAVRDLEERYGAFLITPIGDVDGTAVITHP